MEDNNLDNDINYNMQTPNNSWGARIQSSLLIGLIVSSIWMVIMHISGTYNIFKGGAGQLSTFFGNAIGIFFVISAAALILKSALFLIKKK